MKTIISILVLAIGSLTILINGKEVDHRSCSCTGTFCSCSTSCLDHGEIPNCVCSTFSCICKCDPKDSKKADDAGKVTMSPDQESNSIKGETYFRSNGGTEGRVIADAIKGLREAILSGNQTAYREHARIAETTYERLPEAQQAAWEKWSLLNLKKQ